MESPRVVIDCIRENTTFRAGSPVLVDQTPRDGSGLLELNPDWLRLISLDFDVRTQTLLLLHDDNGLGLAWIGVDKRELGTGHEIAIQAQVLKADRVCSKNRPTIWPKDLYMLKPAGSEDDVGDHRPLGTPGVDRDQGLISIHLILEIGRVQDIAGDPEIERSGGEEAGSVRPDRQEASAGQGQRAEMAIGIGGELGFIRHVVVEE